MMYVPNFQPGHRFIKTDISAFELYYKEINDLKQNADNLLVKKDVVALVGQISNIDRLEASYSQFTYLANLNEEELFKRYGACLQYGGKKPFLRFNQDLKDMY
jgi:hypothetical protein